MFAVLLLPEFALQAVLRLEHGLAGRPVALLSSDDADAVVRHLTPSARAAGIAAGMTAPQAMARCAEVVLKFPAAAAEQEARQALLACAWALSPRVELTAEGAATIDLCGHAAGAVEAPARAVLARLAALGLAARLGVARTARLARYAAEVEAGADVLRVIAAQAADERSFLAPLPVTLAEPTAEQVKVLAGWGIRTLGALLALPAREAALRLGAGGEALWRRAAGEEERVLRLEEPPREFAAAHEFEHEIETLEPLLFLLRRFCDQLVVQLAAAGMAAAELRLVLTLSAGAPHERSFRLPEPTLDAGALFRVLLAHLEAVRTEATVAGLRLEAQPARPQHKQHGLFDGSLRDPHGFNETLARVAAVVGADRVGQPVADDTHRPDAVRAGPVPETVWAESAEFAVEEPAERPGGRGLALRRFRPLRPARVQLGEGGPAWITSPGLAGPVAACRGPFPLSGDWWTPAGWSRTEWDVELAAGGVYRIFQDAGGWYVEGEYD